VVAVHEARAELERDHMADIRRELDEPGLVQVVEVSQLLLERGGQTRCAFGRLEGAAARAAHEQEGEEHHEQQDRNRPEDATDDEGGERHRQC
jgi:hypothetical protein